MKKERRRSMVEKIIFLVVLLTLIASIVVVLVTMGRAPTQSNVPHVRIKSDYVLMLLECVAGILAMGAPSLLRRKIGLTIPSRMMIIYVLFLYCAIYLGEVRSFFYDVPNWDTILHIGSGVMLGSLGFSLISLLNKTDTVPVNMSPIFIAVFSFCFAVSVGSLWEIYEFAADGILQTNMQKFAIEGGADLSGREALKDTMEDLIVDVVGAFVISLIGYISVKFRKGWMEKLQVTVNRNDVDEKL